MKLYIDFEDGNGNELAGEFTANDELLLKSSIAAFNFKDDLKRRVHWIVEEKMKVTTGQLISEWVPKLLPTNPDLPRDDNKMLAIIFADPNYKDAQAKAIDIAIIQINKTGMASEIDNYVNSLPVGLKDLLKDAVDNRKAELSQ